MGRGSRSGAWGQEEVVSSRAPQVARRGQTHILEASHRVGVSSHQHPLGHGFQLALAGDLQSRGRRGIQDLGRGIGGLKTGFLSLRLYFAFSRN